MVLANMAITPLFMKVPFSELMKIMLPAIIPFNLIKASVNGTIGAILYIPLHTSVAKYLDKQVVTDEDIANTPPALVDEVENAENLAKGIDADSIESNQNSDDSALKCKETDSSVANE